MGIATGQFHDNRDIAEKIIDFLIDTERQSQYQDRKLNAKEASHGQGPNNNFHTHSPVHDDSVAEWVTDCHIAVISHDCYQYTVRASQEGKEEHLGPTASQGDGDLSCRSYVGQSEGCNGTRISNFQTCQVSQDGVDDGVDDETNGSIPKQTSQVENQKSPENQLPHAWVRCEWLEVELYNSSWVFSLHINLHISLLWVKRREENITEKPALGNQEIR